MTNSTNELDATGLKCPLPVLRARKALRDVTPGEVLTVLATDAAAPSDFRAFCEQAGHEFVECTEEDETFTIKIRRAS
jgi:TusA-related sulfurtransferase